MALPMMARALVARGLQVDVATTDDDGPGRRLKDIGQGVPLEQEGFRVFYFSKQTEFYKASLPLAAWLLRHVADYDVVHIHAVFSFSTLAAGLACQMRGVPYVVRPLGVLNSWGMQNRRRWIKSLSFRLLDKPVLDRAAAMHYTSQQEAEDAVRLGIRARAEVIPLGIDLEPFQFLPSPELFASRFPVTKGRPIILFLSRLDPKKNVELLLEGMTRLRSTESDPIRPDPTRSNPILVVAGSGDPEYVAELEVRASNLGLENAVLWTGHLDGDMKLSALAACDIFVLPSRSENFGIALLEAMAAGRACLSTAGVALAVEAAVAGAVRICEPTPEGLCAALLELLASAQDRERLGRASSALAVKEYSSQSMAGRMEAYYHTIQTPRTTP